jgi:carbonic anhydrase
MSAAQPHTAKAIVFTCMDERLSNHVEKIIHSLPGGAFHAALAGGGGAFSFDSDKAVALKQVIAAYHINKITDIYLESHLSCGAYTLAGVTFADQTTEISRLHQDLATARRLITEALLAERVPAGTVHVHTRVIDLAGRPVKKPELAKAI